MDFGLGLGQDCQQFVKGPKSLPTFYTMYLYEGTFSTLLIIKAKYQSTLKTAHSMSYII